MIYWFSRRDDLIDTLITAPVYKWDRQDDALRVRTEARRKAADAMRARAAHVESGEPVSTILRRVK